MRRGNLGDSRTHQASDIAELRYEILSLLELIACIGCLVKSNKASVAVDNELVSCRCHSDNFCSGFAFRNY